MNHVLVAGATGLIGQALLNELTEAQCVKVTALTRREMTLPHQHQQFQLVDYANLKLPKAVDNTDTVICALGTTIKIAGSKTGFAAVDYDMVITLATKAKQMGYQSFTVISSIGADKPSNSFYLTTKFKMETSLRSLGFEKLIIVRPSLLLGARQEFRIGERIAQWMSVVLNPLLVGKLKKYRPVHATAVARAIVKQNQDTKLGIIVLDNLALLNQ